MSFKIERFESMISFKKRMFQLVQKPKISFDLSTNPGGQPGVQPVFWAEQTSRNKATPRNISATTNKQKNL